MPEQPDDPSLLAVATAIADGAPVDWDDVQHSLSDPDQQRLALRLQQIATMAVAHRPETAAPAETDPGGGARWRHLMLFEQVGEGACGTVWRGWDSKLDREVAVKRLPRTRATSSPLDEARHLARIRHANVVTVHGADADSDGVVIWMEYIRGETLHRMVRTAGPMSAREVAGIGIDLCHALSALHGAGLLHRDIKAHNVMREVGGRIVLMDFSGAHGFEPTGTSSHFTGTPLYMAPELFAGAAATPASDVYSLGVLLFFLLSGTVPVDASSVADLKAAHGSGARKRLRDLRSDLPNAIVQVIERTIGHDPAGRYQTAGELEHALAAASGSPAAAAAAEAGRPTRHLWQLWAAAAGLAAVVVASVWWWTRPAQAPPPVVRFAIGPPYLAGSWPRLSPSGRLVAFGAFIEGRNRFWIRALDAVDGRVLANTVATDAPFWSPDERVLAFFDDGKLKTVPIDGGNLHVLADAPYPRGGDWSGDWIIYSRNTGIHRIAPDGSREASVTTLDGAQGDQQHAWPEFLPDGKRFLYIVRSTNPARTGLYVGSVDGSPGVRLMDAHSRAVYSAGHLLYVRGGTLVAHPFDAARAVLSGEPVPIATRIQHHVRGDAAFDVSTSGVLTYSVAAGFMTSRLALYDRRGREMRSLTHPGAHRHPRFSPDGRRVAAERMDYPNTNADIWLYDVDRMSETRLTSSEAPDVRPVWSADGRRIAFSSKRDEAFHIFSKTIDATAPEERIVSLPGDKLVEHWSRDGSYFAATIRRSGLWIIPLASPARAWRARDDDGGDDWHAEFSPDGRWLAYTSEESRRGEVYVEPFPATGARWQVSTRGGGEPHWRADGKELFFLQADGMLVSLDVSAPRWERAAPTPLFRAAVPDVAGSLDYSVSPDGQLFVVNVFVADRTMPPIDVVVNWPSLLKR